MGGMGPWWGGYSGGMNPYASPFVSPWSVSGMPTAPFYAPTGVLDDSEMASYVRDNIDLDPYISVKDKNSIDVDVSGGTATLTGKVSSRRSKGLAYADAFWVAGILDVVDELKIEGAPGPAAPKKAGRPKREE